MQSNCYNSTGPIFFAISVLTHCYFLKVRKPILLTGNPTTEKLLSKCPSLCQLYWPSIVFNDAHLIFIPFIIQGLLYKFFIPFKYVSCIVVAKDGEELQVDFICPNDEYALQEFVSHPVYDGYFALKQDLVKSTTIVVLHHGAMCDSRDLPGQGYIRQAHSRNWLVCCLNRRGHVRPLTCPRWNFFGSTEDVRTLTADILSKRPKAQLLSIGLSSGSGLLARHLGESGNDFSAGVGVCPGYNIEKCMARFKFPYQELLLWRGKSFFLVANEALLSCVEGFSACLQAQNLQEWLDSSYAMAGYASKEDYYNNCNPMRTISQIKVPSLFINSQDDPICIVENVQENMERFRESKSAALALTAAGSHLPFYELWTPGRGLFSCWAERVAYEFFDAVLDSETSS